MNSTILKAIITKAKYLDMDTNDCWTWIGSKNSKGYGTLTYTGQHYKAHRFFWEIAKGEYPPDDMELDHLCRNRACVNPEHLELVTHQENVARGLNAKKYFCPNGHEKGTRMSKGKPRLECFECRKLRDKASYAARKAAL